MVRNDGSSNSNSKLKGNEGHYENKRIVFTFVGDRMAMAECVFSQCNCFQRLNVYIIIQVNYITNSAIPLFQVGKTYL